MERFWEHYTDPIPNGLVEALQHNRLVAFVGSGVSQRCLAKTRAPLPSWSGLLDTLIEWGQMTGHLDDQVHRELNELLSRGEFLTVAQECRDQLGDDLLGEFIRTVFDPDGVTPSRVHDLIAVTPFAGYITTNYDNLLERAYSRTHNRQLRTVLPESVGDLVGEFGRSRALLKLHGDLDAPGSIVLGHRDYLRLLWTRQYSNLIRSIFSEFTLIFIGYGLADLDILLPLDQLVHEGLKFQHYMLSKRGTRNSVERRRLLLDRQIQVIEYVDHFDHHNHVDTFLEGLLRESDNVDKLNRARADLRCRVCIFQEPEDAQDGAFVRNFFFREGSIILAPEYPESHREYLQRRLAEGLSCLDHLIFIFSSATISKVDLLDALSQSAVAAQAAGVLIVVLAIGLESRDELPRIARTFPIFFRPAAFSESDLSACRAFLAEDLKGGHRQP